MKKCFKCLQEKPLSEFYRHAYMADGYLGKCKSCTKADATAHRIANLEKVRAYDRRRGLSPERKKRNKANYRRRISTPEGRANEWARSKAWRESNKVKRAAQVIIGHEIRAGRLEAKPCQRCGATKRIHAHHEDYTKPLEVMWLCRKCHGKRHREINEEKRN